MAFANDFVRGGRTLVRVQNMGGGTTAWRRGVWMRCVAVHAPGMPTPGHLDCEALPDLNPLPGPRTAF